MTTPSTAARAETVIEEVAHEATITIDASPEDLQPLAYGITCAIRERYQYVMVPGTFAVHSDGSNTCKWTWKTRRSDVPAEEEEGR